MKNKPNVIYSYADIQNALTNPPYFQSTQATIIIAFQTNKHNGVLFVSGRLIRYVFLPLFFVHSISTNRELDNARPPKTRRN